MDITQGIVASCPSGLEGASAHIFLTLINMLMSSQCPLGSKDYYPEDYGPLLTEKEKFDFIIVGGGSSGSVLASKLLENINWRILVLEAGGYPSATSDIPSLLFNLQNTDSDWQYRTEKSNESCLEYKYSQCRWPRGKLLGGSSSINAMIYNRGNSRDYDQWEEMGNSGWSYKDLERNFKEIENIRSTKFDIKFHGKNGFQDLSWYDNEEPITQSLMEAAKLMGYPTFLEQDPHKPLGYFQSMLSIDHGVRINAARAFLGKNREKENVYVITRARVTKVLIDSSSNQAYGVQVKLGRKTLNILAKKEVILSSGSINSPQILMLSGIGINNDLDKLGINTITDLPVGENLQDHLVVPLFFKIGKTAFIERHPASVVDDLYKYFMYKMGPLGTIHITNLLGFINTKNNSIFPNIQFHHIGHFQNDKILLPQMLKSFGFEGAAIKNLVEINKNSALLNFFPVLINPKSKGRVKLRTKDPMDTPKIYSGYLTDKDGEDMKTILEGIRFVQNLQKTPPLQLHKLEFIKLPLAACDALQYDSDNYWKCYVKHLGTTIYHQVGTVKMGPSNDKEAVVDSRLRVYGIKKLRVVDASIMPKVTSGNTNAPSMVIGHKGGELLIEDWRNTNQHDEF